MRASPTSAVSSTASWSTRRARTSARSSRGPTCAGESAAQVAGLAALQARILERPPPACGRAGGSSIRPARSAQRKTSVRSRIFSAGTRSFRQSTCPVPILRSLNRPPNRGRFLQTLPHRRRDGRLFHRRPGKAHRRRRRSTRQKARRRCGRSVAGLPALQRALAAPKPAAGQLPLRLLPRALPAHVALHELRRALDDRPDERHVEPDLRTLRRLHAQTGLTRYADAWAAS